nr:nuclear transport factor 2 like domain [Pandoravirus massiliensis]
MNTLFAVFACLALALCVAAPCFAQSPTPLPVPCSSAANKTLADACLLTLAMTHLHYEETGQWGPLLDTMSPDAYEIYGHTLMGGVNTAPSTSDQSLYHMYANILNGGQPDDLIYVPVTTTIGTNTIVYEYVTVFNHTKNFWLVPYPATNRMVSVGMVLTLGFDDNNKMTYERFFVDSASILVQIGILKDGYGVYGNDLAAPYPPGKACKRHLPVAADQFASILIDGPYGAGVEFNGFYVNEAANLAERSTDDDAAASAQHRKRQERRQYDSFSALVMAELANIML